MNTVPLVRALALFVALNIAAGPVVAQPSAKPAPSPGARPSGQSGAVIDLRPKFIQGHELRYRMTTRSSGTTDMPDLADPLEGDAGTGQKPAPRQSPGNKAAPKNAAPDQTMDQVVDVRFRVVEVAPEGGAEVEMIVDALKVKGTGPFGETDFDSSKAQAAKGDDPVADLFRRIVGATLTLRIDRDGNITEVSGGEALFIGGPGDPGAALLSGGAVKRSWGPIFTGRKGAGEARVGEKWTTTDALESSPIGSFAMTTESVVKSARAGVAEVEFKGRVEPSRESAKEGDGVQIRSATYGGAYTWDNGAGALKSLKCRQSIEAEALLGGMKISTSQKSDTTIERLEGRSGPGARTGPSKNPDRFQPRTPPGSGGR